MRGGFTLLEVLLAVAISCMIVGSAFMLCQSFGLAASSFTNTQRDRLAAQAALDRIERDLSCALRISGDTGAQFILLPPSASPNDASALVFYTVSMPPGSSAESPSLPRIEKVRYIVELDKAGHDGELLLVREAQDRSDPQNPIMTTEREVLATGVRIFNVQAFDGKSWQGKWPAPDSAPMPAGARVFIGVGSSDTNNTLESIVSIGAGRAGNK